MKTLCKFVLGLTLALPLLASALDFKQIESSGAQRLYAAKTSAISSHTVSGYGLGYSLYAVGGSADFRIFHSTVAGGSNFVNVSSTVYLLQGQSINGEFRAMVFNPSISIDRIDAATTIYIEVPYLAPRAPGAF